MVIAGKNTCQETEIGRYANVCQQRANSSFTSIPRKQHPFDDASQIFHDGVEADAVTELIDPFEKGDVPNTIAPMAQL